MCSVYARAGEEKKTQKLRFWKLYDTSYVNTWKIWLGNIDFRPILLETPYAAKSITNPYAAKSLLQFIDLGVQQQQQQ